MRKLELYFTSISGQSLEIPSRANTTYKLNSVEQSADYPIDCSSLDEVAKHLAFQLEVFPPSFTYDKIILYNSTQSTPDKIRAGPFLEASRENVSVIGATSKEDYLLKIQKHLSKRISKTRAKQSEKPLKA